MLNAQTAIWLCCGVDVVGKLLVHLCIRRSSISSVEKSYMGKAKSAFSIIGWTVLGLVGLMVLGVLIMMVAMVGRSFMGQEYSGSKSDHLVSVVELTGEILSSTEFRKDLKKQVNNKKVKAIVVRIDSPGGAVGASEEIYRAIQRARTEKPVVCSLGNVAASGGLYAAMGCEKVVTNRSTLTGSIGAVFMLPNFESIMDRFGLKMNVIKSGQFKDSGSPFRPMSAGDQKLFQDLVNEVYEQFIEVVAESRGLELENVRKFADGRVLTGDRALELGLVDEVGTLRDAAKIALELAGDDEEPEIIMPKKPTGIWAILEGVPNSSLAYWWRSFDGVGVLLYRGFL